MTYLQAILDLKFKIDEIVLLKSNFNVDKIFSMNIQSIIMKIS